MTVKQALKLKNKLVQELNELQVRLQANNSVIEGNVRNYSSKETLSEIYKKVDELNFIKTNDNNFKDMLSLEELKSLLNIKSFAEMPNTSPDNCIGLRNNTRDPYTL